MKSMKEIIENAKAKALNSGKSVMVYDTGHDFELILDGEGQGNGTLAYIISPSGEVQMVDG